MKARSNRWLARIAKTVDESDQERAIQRLVCQFRPANETLETLAQKLGVDQIMLEPLPFDGGVYEENGKRIIKINSLAPVIRQKFTLAHELGHLILERSVRGTFACSDDNALERACNCVAAELLMPAAQAQELARQFGVQSPEKLSPIANHFGVSLQTAAQRLYDLHLWTLGTGMWRCETVPRQQWFVGPRPWRTDTPALSVFDLAIESRTPIQTTEYIAKGTYTDLVALKAFHIGKKFVIAVVAQ